jgi:hypothetical protein
MVTGAKSKETRMADRFKYERPVLVDMASGSALGYSGTCDGGSCNNECALGSCISSAWCQDGGYTGYCENGTGDCNKSSSCYVCCDSGAMVGFYGSGAGSTTYCQCSSGANAASLCYNGTRVSSICINGDTAYEDCNGGCA